MGVTLDGTISQNGPAMQVHDELHARALVLDDGATRLAIVLVDCTMIEREIFDRAKKIVTDSTGLPRNAARHDLRASSLAACRRPGYWRAFSPKNLRRELATLVSASYVPTPMARRC